MVERAEADRFPITVVVTLQAIGSEASLMFVLMAVAAARRNSEKSFAQVLYFDDRAFAPGNALRRVTPVTYQP
jgi:hypothetical protein